MKRLARVLAFLLCTFFCPPDSTAKNLFLNDKNFDMITPEGHLFYKAADFYPLAKKALRDDDEASIEQLRDMALQGDFKALAALTLITRLHEQLGRTRGTKIPAQFWEDWMYRLLGEQEGGYILGPFRKEPPPFWIQTRQVHCSFVWGQKLCAGRPKQAMQKPCSASACLLAASPPRTSAYLLKRTFLLPRKKWLMRPIPQKFSTGWARPLPAVRLAQVCLWG